MPRAILIDTKYSRLYTHTSTRITKISSNLNECIWVLFHHPTATILPLHKHIYFLKHLLLYEYLPKMIFIFTLYALPILQWLEVDSASKNKNNLYNFWCKDDAFIFMPKMLRFAVAFYYR